MVVVRRNKQQLASPSAGILRNSTARLLVLGDKQVGKSASIVRFTTGRFIQDYCQTTNDWLYRHPINIDNNNTSEKQLGITFNSSSHNGNSYVELLEQKNLLAFETTNLKNQFDEILIQSTRRQQQSSSLATRVALDQQLDNELSEKQQLLQKLHWADAYIVIYAINDVNSFNKAIKYLNLIANTININTGNLPPPIGHRGVLSNISNGQNSIGNNNKSGNCSSCSSQQNVNLNCSSSTIAASQQQVTRHRPILLLGNKRDLESTSRQVPTNDGRLLAIRHQILFAEMSIAQSGRQLEDALMDLLEQINPNDLHIDLVNQSTSSANHLQQQQQQSQLILWMPPPQIPEFVHQAPAPIWASLVKTKLNGHSTTVGSGRLLPAARSQEAEHRNHMTPMTCVPLVAASSNQRLPPIRAECMGLVKANRVPIRPVIERTPCPTVARSVVQEQARPLIAGSVLRSLVPIGSSSANQPKSGRYQSFKSSFKKASMAIVNHKQVVATPAAAAATTAPKKRVSPSTFSSKKNSLEMDIYQGTVSDSSDTNSSKTQLSLSDRSSNWIKNHIKSLGSSRNSVTSAESKSPHHHNYHQAQTGNSAGIADRFKRPLLKYRTRHRTVAFDQLAGHCQTSADESASLGGGTSTEPLASSQTDTESIASQSMARLTTGLSGLNLAKLESNNTSRTNQQQQQQQQQQQLYNQTRCSSGRSSSSLSTSDTYYSSSLFLVGGHHDQHHDRAHQQTTTTTTPPTSAAHPQQQQQQHQLETNRIPSSTGSTSTCSSSMSQLKRVNERKNSRSTLSRASTSAGSYEDSGDELVVAAAAYSQTLIEPTTLPPTTTATTTLKSTTTGNLMDHSGITKKTLVNRYPQQLVRTVQSTLTNLTRPNNNLSSSASLHHHHSAKRSFCSSLFKNTPTNNSSNNNKTLTQQSIQYMVKTIKPSTCEPLSRATEHLVGADQMAQVEQLQNLPIIGYCK